MQYRDIPRPQYVLLGWHYPVVTDYTRTKNKSTIVTDGASY